MIFGRKPKGAADQQPAAEQLSDAEAPDTDPTSAEAPVAMPYTSRFSAKTWRRPMRSASRPPSDAQAHETEF